MRSLILAILLMASLLSACSFLPLEPWPIEVLVVQPGESISAETSVGSVTITANDLLTRTVILEGASRSVRLFYPTKELYYPMETRSGPFFFPRPTRWRGVMGTYNLYQVVQEHHGITRIFLQESRLSFERVEEALNFLQEPAYQPSVYNDDGVFIRFSKTPEDGHLCVDVEQIYIGDRKPTHLPGSQNKNIQVFRHTLQMRPKR